MKTTMITATEANQGFSDILNRVRYQGQTFEITRGKEVIAKLIPVHTKHSFTVRELTSFLKQLPPLTSEDKKDFERDIHNIRNHMQLKDNPWD